MRLCRSIHRIQKGLRLVPALLFAATSFAALAQEIPFAGLSEQEGELDLSAIPELQSLAISNSIELSIWRNKHHRAAGGTITDLTFERLR